MPARQIRYTLSSGTPVASSNRRNPNLNRESACLWPDEVRCGVIDRLRRRKSLHLISRNPESDFVDIQSLSPSVRLECQTRATRSIDVVCDRSSCGVEEDTCEE